MKLARPDVFHPRIVLAGTPHRDDAGLVAALRTRGLQARWLPWTDAATLDADLVILREHSDQPEFTGWTRRVRHLLNDPDVVGWNGGRRPRRSDPREATALVFLGGAQSHAFTATAAVDADFAVWDTGQAALQAAARTIGISVEQLLYARVDVAHDSQVLDVDLVAPQLGWRLLDDADREEALHRFALCVESALERLGLGPLSHRRP